ncbi:GNAT family N-acetyltransferase [Ornithinimicrobium sp. Arc0846-15]|nr:GNAT family N-acetyltransferase [Ornithinimicrobium laminariae]
MPELEIQRSHVAQIEPETLYALMRLRVDVFVVEQECPYPELDGRDLERDAQQWWIEVEGEIASTVRTLRDNAGQEGANWRIGRVATHANHRGQGHAAALMHAAIEHCADAPIDIEAQAHLEQWYAKFGFVRCGDDFLEDGIPHLPMRLEHAS